MGKSVIVLACLALFTVSCEKKEKSEEPDLDSMVLQEKTEEEERSIADEESSLHRPFR